MFKVIALICVYSLHIVFFEALMAKPNAESTCFFNDFFNRNEEQKKDNSSSAVHYYHLHKHANNSERLTFALNDVAFCSTPAVVLPQAKQIPPVSLWLFYSHLPDDAFKVYERIRVFLI